MQPSRQRFSAIYDSYHASTWLVTELSGRTGREAIGRSVSALPAELGSENLKAARQDGRALSLGDVVTLMGGVREVK